MVFVVDDLVAWLVALVADTGRKKLTTLLLGSDQQRALRQAAVAAVERTAEQLAPSGGEQAEQLAMVVGEVFREPATYAAVARQATLLEVGLHGAAEWWHRRRFDGHHTAPADHDRRVSRLLQAAEANPDVSADDVEWLTRKLQNSNNKSQLDRLLDIAGTVPDLMRDLVADPEAVGSSGPGAAYSWAQ